MCQQNCLTHLGRHAQTLLNVADTHVALGEAQAGGGQPEEAQAAFQRGVAGYTEACSLCSSEAGDDLPGLLHNWGVGLHAWATHTQVGPKHSWITRCWYCLSGLLCTGGMGLHAWATDTQVQTSTERLLVPGMSGTVAVGAA